MITIVVNIINNFILIFIIHHVCKTFLCLTCTVVSLKTGSLCTRVHTFAGGPGVLSDCFSGGVSSVVPGGSTST